MTRYTFGEATDEDDVLVVQGIEYPMQPLGMRAMKRLLNLKNQLPTDADAGNIKADQLDMATDIVVASVRKDVQDALREHIEDRVGPALLTQIAKAVMSSMSDLDPTQPASSSDGSPPVDAGSTSTDGAEPEASTPST
jgi:hypothetical protein